MSFIFSWRHVWKALFLVVVLPTSACVATVAYTQSPASPESALRALTAERSLNHGQAQSAREHDPGYTRISFCTAQGSRVEAVKVRVTDEGVCGQQIDGSVTAAASTRESERCWRFEEIAMIGQPRDASVIGYYPVRGYLRCPGSS